MMTTKDTHPAALAPLDRLAWHASADVFEERGDMIGAERCRRVARLLDMDTFTAAYVDYALDMVWACGEDTHEMGELADVSWDTLAEMLIDCEDFQDGEWDDDTLVRDVIAGRERMAGYHFYLTRNGHGAGFWDGRWEDIDPAGRLDKMADTYGTFELYRGDDGRIYHHN